MNRDAVSSAFKRTNVIAPDRMTASSNLSALPFAVNHDFDTIFSFSRFSFFIGQGLQTVQHDNETGFAGAHKGIERCARVNIVLFHHSVPNLIGNTVKRKMGNFGLFFKDFASNLDSTVKIQ